MGVMKFLLTAILLPGLAAGAILPDKIGTYQRGAVSKPALTDPAIWKEFGWKDSESAVYTADKAKFTVTAWQLQDTTGSLAAFQWQRPADSKPSPAANMAAQTANGLTLVYGNYLFSFDGYIPSKEDLDGIYATLHNVDRTTLPTLPGYLPTEGLVPNSQRYISGPASLERFAAGIPASVAAFRMGAEGQTGVFHSPKGDTSLAIFSYPTPQIAMQRVTEFEKIPGAMARRSVSLVTVVLSPADSDYAEKLLSQVRFQAQVTEDQYVPTKRDNIGDLVITAFILIGILIAFSVVSGLALGGFRAWRRHARHGEEADALTTLNL